MARKPHLKVIADDINNVATAVGEDGYFVVYGTGAQVHVPTGALWTSEPSGKVIAGMLLINVVNRGVPSLQGRVGDPLGVVDPTQNNIIPSRNETHVSGQVRILKIGEASTNALKSGITFAAGNPLYVSQLGKLTNVTTNLSPTTVVGRALDVKDTDGYLKVFINIL